MRDSVSPVCGISFVSQINLHFWLYDFPQLYISILQEEEYTVTISTELNGRTVTQTVEKFPMGHPEPS